MTAVQVSYILMQLLACMVHNAALCHASVSQPGSSFSMLAAQAVKYAVTCKGPKGCQHAERRHQRISLSAFRYRCAACKQDFCGQCFATPYHAELTCEEHKAPKCLYCQAPLLEEDSYMDADR